MVTVTGWTIDEIEAMPFIDAVQLFEYWADHPPVHLMVAAYLGIEPKKPVTSAIEMAEAMQIMTGSRRASKLKDAPERDRIRFEHLKEMAKKQKNAR